MCNNKSEKQSYLIMSSPETDTKASGKRQNTEMTLSENRDKYKDYSKQTTTTTTTTSTTSRSKRNSKKRRKLDNNEPVSKVTVILDNRETHLISLLSEIFGGSLPNGFTTMTLELGDIVLCESGVPRMVIERKEVNDLMSSFCDGRLHTQRAKLMNVKQKDPSIEIAIIVEGYLDDVPFDKHPKVSKLTIQKTIWSFAQLGFQVFYTENLSNTGELTMTLCKNMSSSQSGNIASAIISSISDLQFMGSGKAKTPQEFQESIFAKINQVTSKMSKAIIDKYGSVGNLLKEYSDISNPKEREKLLVGLQYKTKKDSDAKIGFRISKKIYEFIFFKHVY